MKNRKMNLDRPPLESKEIQAGMNFGQLLVTYQAMSKPFYKTKWFFGTTGMASIGLIVGGTIAFQETDSSVTQQELTTVASPPLSIVDSDAPTDLLASVAAPQTSESTTEKTFEVQPKQLFHDKNLTQVVNSDQTELTVETNLTEQVVDQSDENQTSKSGFDPMDLTPRINGRLNGEITREDLMNNQGLTTNADISVIHFELHLIDGLGGKVFEEESNQLNQQMKAALNNVDKGETIYFENIRGKTSDGIVVRLNPLRYVLLN